MAGRLRHRPHHGRDRVGRIVEVEPKRQPARRELLVWNNRAEILGRGHVRRAHSLRLGLQKRLHGFVRVVQVESIRQSARRKVRMDVLRVGYLARLDDPVVQVPRHVAVENELPSVLVESSPVVLGLRRLRFLLPGNLLLPRDLMFYFLPLGVRVVLLLLFHLGADLAKKRKIQSLDEVRVLHVASQVLRLLDGQLAELVLCTGRRVTRNLPRDRPGEERLIAHVVRVGLLAPLLGSVAIRRALGLVLDGLRAGFGLELWLGSLELAAVPTPAAAADGPRRHQKLRGLKGSVVRSDHRFVKKQNRQSLRLRRGTHLSKVGIRLWLGLFGHRIGIIRRQWIGHIVRPHRAPPEVSTPSTATVQEPSDFWASSYIFSSGLKRN